MSCVYKISVLKNGGFYIGSTKNAIKRKSRHKKELDIGLHHCHKLQQEATKHGMSEFSFEILADSIPDDKLRAVEYTFIQIESDNPKCYNVAQSNSLEEETKLKISASLIKHYANNPHPRQGIKHTEETRAKIKANITVRKGEDHYRFGQTLSEEVRKKIGDTQRGVPKAPRTITPEGRAKIKTAAEAGHYSHWQGKTHTDESKAKMSTPIIEITTNTQFPSLRGACAYYGFNMPTLVRALKSGKAILKGQNKGLSFRYLPQHTE